REPQVTETGKAAAPGHRPHHHVSEVRPTCTLQPNPPTPPGGFDGYPHQRPHRRHRRGSHRGCASTKGGCCPPGRSRRGPCRNVNRPAGRNAGQGDEPVNPVWDIRSEERRVGEEG